MNSIENLMINSLEFPLVQLFDVKIGKAISKNSVTFCSKSSSSHPYISRKETNNGFEGYIEYDKEYLYSNDSFVITIGNEVATAFVQDSSFYTGTKVNILKPKFEPTIENMQFIAQIMTYSFKRKYSYAYTINSTNLKKETIRLPELNGKPDYKAMSSYIENLNEKKLVKIQVLKEPLIKTKQDLKAIKWAEFKLTNFFKMTAGKYYSKDEYEIGETPLISTTDNNNGILNSFNTPPVFEGNELTIGKVGCVCFYQEKPFIASPDVTVLTPKENFLNKYNGLFLSRVISMEKNKWTYGRQIRLGDCMELKILLPEKNGEPDWDFMSNYIKGLNYSSKL